MKNCIILGSGRSGTSMVAGLVAESGYHLGDDLYPPRDSNPKGFFESPFINRINEDLLSNALPQRPPIIGRWWFHDRPLPNQTWLARVPLDLNIGCSKETVERIKHQVQRRPFCFKDPRFSYTLDVWRPSLGDAVFVCIFRDPMVTAASILKECAAAPYLHSLKMDTVIATEVWTLMYEHILVHHRHQGDWLFLHYNQVLDGDGVDRLAAFLDAPVDRNFPDVALCRSVAHDSPPPQALRTYQQLCTLAEYDDE